MDATLTEAIEMLRNNWNEVIDGVLRGKYSIWLGSGISRDRFPDLKKLLEELLEILHSKIDPLLATCPYKKTLKDLVEMTDVGGLDVCVHPNNWTPGSKDKVVKTLLRDYARVLGKAVQLADTQEIFAWDILKIHEKYGDRRILPDAEHKLLALLIEEGVFIDLVTTNWDPLIEVAHEECRGNRDLALKIVASEQDFDESRHVWIARLLKMHGCAFKALQDYEQYHHHLIATRRCINKWIAGSKESFPFQEAIRTTLRRKPALFIGLSGQDCNIHIEFLNTALKDISFETSLPRIIFTASSIDDFQEDILEAIHDENYQTNASLIKQKSALPLYAKPLLGSLYIITLLEKASKLVERGDSELDNFHMDIAKDNIIEFEEFLRNRYDAITDSKERWRMLADELPTFINRFVSLYRFQKIPSHPSSYAPLCEKNIHEIETSQEIIDMNFHWILLALASLKEGEKAGLWTISEPISYDGRSGQFTIQQHGRTIRLFVLNDSSKGSVRLNNQNFINLSNPPGYAILYPSDRQPAQRETMAIKRDLPGLVDWDNIVEIWFRDIAENTTTVSQLVDALKNDFLRVA